MISQLLVGVDGGGSQTRAVVCNAQGQVFGRGSSGSTNFYAVGMEDTAKNLTSAIQEAIAGLDEPQLQSCGLGLAGASSPSDIAVLQAALQPVLAPFFADPAFPMVIEEDAVAAWAGAFAGEVGVICIAGTGANSFGIGVDGKRVKADGVGPLLGDRGSGIDIGRHVLRAASAAFDGSGRHTSLLQASLAHFGLVSVDELVGYVYAPSFARSELAALVPIAAHEAAQGDFVARDILNNAGCELAASAAAAIRRITLAEGLPVLVAPMGGVLENVELVRASFERELPTLSAHPVIIQAPRFDAAVGAALLPQILHPR